MSTVTLTPEITGIGRASEIGAILEHVASGRCCSLVSVSNMGKSMLLRALSQPPVLRAAFGEQAPRHLLLYVDCNRMLQLTEQGLYELVLRCLQEAEPHVAVLAPLDALIQQAYTEVLRPASPLAMPLAFNRTICALLTAGEQRLTLILDEFDDPLRVLDGRVLLNLRALQEQYHERLSFVTATRTELALVRRARDPGADEFCQLFEGHVITLGPMNRADSLRWLGALRATPALNSGELSDDLAEQLVDQANGHPGLLRAGLSCTLRASSNPTSVTQLAVGGLAAQLDQDPSVQMECERLWETLSPLEQRALEQLTRSRTSRPSAAVHNLLHKGLVRDDGTQLVPFAPVWERYVRLHAESRAAQSRGVRIDPVHSEVRVDGRAIPYLTPLEHRLLVTLYERMGQICSKEHLVEAIYGRSYIDSDLPALQRLIHRLRAKIEPNPAKPTHVENVRGRGYRLVAPDPT